MSSKRPLPPKKPPVAAAKEPASGSADRTLRVLSAVAQLGRPLTLAELAQRVALPKPTVHRLCVNLLAAGYLARDVDEKMLVVGASMRRLAFDALNHATLRGLRHGVLTALVEEMGETCNFTTLDGTQVLYLDRVEAQWPLRLTIDVGAHVPLHCTASGKLFLAHLPSRQRSNVIRQLPLPRLTPFTLVDPAAIRSECDAIVGQGFATDREEFVVGLVAIAVPVRDADGVVRAAVSVHAPTGRFDLDDAKARIELLRRAAARMSALL